MQPAENIPSPELSSSDNKGSGASGNGGFENEFGSFVKGVEVEVEGRRPRRKQLQKSIKAAENTQQRKDGLLDTPKKAKALGKKALQAAQEMSQLLDAYTPLSSNIK
jgi:hypothetical protein